MRYILWYTMMSALIHLSQQQPWEILNYKLKIEPHIIPGNFSFDGDSEILLNLTEPTRHFLIYSVNLTIHENSTIFIGEQGSFAPEIHSTDPDFETIMLTFNDELKSGIYRLQMKYSGVIEDFPPGLFWSSYVEGNETKYFIATYFPGTNARKVFPCFDEPLFKTTFDISIKHSPNYTALFNMPAKKILDEQTNDGKIWTEFETTPLMSPHSLAFVVSCFTNISNPEGNFSVWSRNSVLSSFEYVYDVGLKALSVLEDYTQRPYPLPKMNIIAIPKLPWDGGMGFWGLIMIEEDMVLRLTRSEPIDSYETYRRDIVEYETAKYEITLFMVRLVSYQWFGGLVSQTWWTDLWIPEGLSSYLASLLSGKFINDLHIMDYHMVEYNKELFNYDYGPNAVAIYRYFSNVVAPYDKNTMLEQQNIFMALNIKSVAILHMLSNFLTEEVFHTGLKTLLQNKAFRTITTEEFFDIMQNASNGSLPQNVDVAQVMEPYILQTGYPIINVFRNYTTGTITLTQECPGCKKTENDDSKHKFWIPINFATNSSLNFSSTVATHWMDPNQEELIIEGVDPDDWVIFNIQGTGYYLVNYDEKNWWRLSDYLNSYEFQNIHVLNRERLLLDAIGSLNRKTMSEKFLMNLLNYLLHEDHVLPWFTGTGLLRAFYKRDKGLTGFEQRFEEFLNPLFDTYERLENSYNVSNESLISIKMHDPLLQMSGIFDE